MLSYQAGSVLKLSDTRDVGVLFLANSSDFKVRSTGVEVDQSSTGLGVHGSQIVSSGRLSASLTTESGTADIAQSGTTGRYDFRQTNASLGWSTSLMLGETTLSPSVSRSVQAYTRDSCTDSAANTVAGTSETNLGLTLGARASQPFGFAQVNAVEAVVPFASATLTYTAFEDDQITVSSTEVVDKEALSASLSVGADAAWRSDLQTGIALALAGLQAGSTPNPSIAARLSWPF